MYEKGKIYKLTINECNLIYYGSTCETLTKRLYKHKQHKNTSAKQLFDISDNVQITLVEDFPCERKEQLLARERFYIQNNDCVNKNIPGRTLLEWKNDNKERVDLINKRYRENNQNVIKERKHQYYLNNKETILLKCKEDITKKENKKEKFTCVVCNSIVSIGNRSEHTKTKKHTNYLI